MIHVDILACMFLLVVYGSRCQSNEDEVKSQFCSCWHLDNVTQRIHKDSQNPFTDIGLTFNNCSDPRNTKKQPNLYKTMIFAIDVWMLEKDKAEDQLVAELSMECNISKFKCVHSMTFNMTPNIMYAVVVFPYCGQRCDGCNAIEYHFTRTVVDKETERKTPTIPEAQPRESEAKIPLLIVSVLFVLLFILVALIALFKYRRTIKYKRSMQHNIPQVEVKLNNTPERITNYTSVMKKIFVATHPLNPKKSEDQKMIYFIDILKSFHQLDVNHLNHFDLNMLESISVNIQDCDIVVLVLSPHLVSLCKLSTDDIINVQIYSQEMRYMVAQIEQYCRRRSDSKPLYLVNLEPTKEHIETLEKTKLFQNISVLFNLKDMSKTDDHFQKLITCIIPND